MKISRPPNESEVEHVDVCTVSLAFTSVHPVHGMKLYTPESLALLATRKPVGETEVDSWYSCMNCCVR